MDGRNDPEGSASGVDGNETPPGEERSAEQRVMAVTAIDYRGRVLTVVSRSDIAHPNAQATGLMSFTTIILSGPLGQLTWTAETWRESLRNHEMAVSKLIRSMTSECGV
ncbi:MULTISPECIES: hypothetical protein [unclassified Bradyrhizobium]|uniref:hypothetical protein n=1 Tax=unclassified Bradyrhizobium TaxID=2631580 RepID=UPI0028EDAC35|nr:MULTISPECIES: hypothetical protein [unclassified Bradyrhizobium]